MDSFYLLSPLWALSLLSLFWGRYDFIWILPSYIGWFLAAQAGEKTAQKNNQDGEKINREEWKGIRTSPLFHGFALAVAFTCAFTGGVSAFPISSSSLLVNSLPQIASFTAGLTLTFFHLIVLVNGADVLVSEKSRGLPGNISIIAIAPIAFLITASFSIGLSPLFYFVWPVLNAAMLSAHFLPLREKYVIFPIKAFYAATSLLALIPILALFGIETLPLIALVSALSVIIEHRVWFHNPSYSLKTQKRSIRIAFLMEPSPFTYISGVGTRYYNTIKELRAAGAEVIALTPGGPTDFCGAKIVQLQGFTPFFYNHHNYKLAHGLDFEGLTSVRDFQPDLLHAVAPGAFMLTGIFYTYLLGIPFIVGYHTNVADYLPHFGLGFAKEPFWWAVAFLCNFANFTISTSEQMYHVMIQKGVHYGKVWPKGIDSSLFNPKHKSVEMRKKLSMGHPERPLLLYIGRLSKEKSITDLSIIMKDLDVRAQSDPRLKNSMLAIVGEGPYDAELREHFKDLSDRVYFAGSMTGEALASAYASVDVFTFPSETETLGFVVLEAMSCGTPVVAPAAGGIPTMIWDNGKNGFLYPIGDLKCASEQVITLLTDSEKRKLIVENGLIEASKFGWKACVEKMLGYYYEAVGFEKRL